MSQQISLASDVHYICHPGYNGWIFSATPQANDSVSYGLQLINCVRQAVGLAGEFVETHNKTRVEYSARYRMTDNRASPGQGEVRPLGVLSDPLGCKERQEISSWREME